MSEFIDKWQRAIKPTLEKDDGVKLPAPSPEPTVSVRALDVLPLKLLSPE